MLQLAGGMGIAAAGALAFRAYDQGVLTGTAGSAYDPWRTWRPDGSRLFASMVGAAILAANPHNTQAWRFGLGANRIDVYGDVTRHVAPIDPIAREFYIGLGCAIENLALAARAAGYTGQVTLLPDPADAGLVASVALAPAPVAMSELYAAIARRRVNRGQYLLNQAVPEGLLAQMERLAETGGVGVRWFSEDEERRRFSELTLAATSAFIADREQSQAAFAWFRGSPREVHLHRDGLTLDTQGMSAAMLAAAKLLPAASREQGDQFWLAKTRDVHLASSPAFGMLLVEQPGRLAWLQVGRSWERLQLWATTQQLAMQPLDQMLQRAEREATLALPSEIGNAIRDLMGNLDLAAALPFRIGYPAAAAALSPRRPVEAVLA